MPIHRDGPDFVNKGIKLELLVYGAHKAAIKEALLNVLQHMSDTDDEVPDDGAILTINNTAEGEFVFTPYDITPSTNPGWGTTEWKPEQENK